MANIINMPRLSDTMEEGTVAKWLKKVGNTINEGDILAEIETDKATMEFEAFEAGTLLHIAIEDGQTAPVDQLLAIIGDKGEDISALIAGGNTTPQATEKKDTTEQVTEAPQNTAIPEGVEIINMPRLSDTMEEGTVAKWLKKVGDTVNEGDILAEIETDKATMEFESFNAGTLLHIAIEEGKSLPVDVLIAIIGPKGTDISGLLSGASAPAKPTPAPTPTKANAPAPVKETPKVAPKKNNSRKIVASPLAKKIAEEKGINLSTVTGTGDQGRIIKRDIEDYTPPVASASTANAVSGVTHTEEIPNSQMRKVIAKRLSESKFTAPHYYLSIEIDMTNSMAFRSQIKDKSEAKISFNDLVLKASATALIKHPQLNTSWTDAATLAHQHINIGVAVAVEDGLVVPVLSHTNMMSLSQIGTTVRELAGKAKDKKLSPEEMSGSTFTVSNLGMFGIEEFTSIINQPNSAILSVGAIIQKPVVKNGEIVVGNTMKVTLACDHRTVDGATAAQFLQTFREYLENPLLMVI